MKSGIEKIRESMSWIAKTILPRNAIVIAVGILSISCQAQSSKLIQETLMYDSPPVLLHQEFMQSIHQDLVQPDLKGRSAKELGVVIVSLIVDLHGLPTHVFAITGGMGLDEKAIEVVRRDRFKPAMKNGEPISAAINIKITFAAATN